MWLPVWCKSAFKKLDILEVFPPLPGVFHKKRLDLEKHHSIMIMCVCVGNPFCPELGLLPVRHDGAIFASNSRVVREEPNSFEGLFMGDGRPNTKVTGERCI